MKLKLMPYQKEGIARIHGFNGRVLLADEQGLGKTIEVLAYLKEIRQWPVVIVVPASLKLQWQKEAKNHFGLKTCILSGTKVVKGLRGHDIYIINYDILGPWVDYLRREKPQVIIGDEIHMIGNLATQRCRNFRMLCHRVPKVLGLSGTPLTNRPFELFPILHVLNPEEYCSPFSYGMSYCDGQKVFGKWQFKGARNLKQLHEKLTRTVMIRRTKLEVLPQLPPKRRSIVTLPLSDAREYIRAERDFVGWLVANYGMFAAQRALRAERYTHFSYLKRLAAKLKMKAVLEWLDNFLEESTGKIFVGVVHHEITKILEARYHGVCTTINGEKTQRQREVAEDLFRNTQQYRILFGQIQAAGVGLNLPECTTVAFVEYPWTPGAMQQFIDRCHRMTSRQPIDIYCLVANETIEEKIFQIIQNKQWTLDKVLDGEDVQESSLTIFDELQALYLRG